MHPCFRIVFSLLIAPLTIPRCIAQAPADPLAAQWTQLIDAKKLNEAATLCHSWTSSPDLHHRVEAEKCLANMELCKGSQLQLNGNELGGGTLGDGFTSEASDAALKHLNAGIDLDPQDLSTHRGRLHVLEAAGRFDAMRAALEDSIERYKGPEAPAVWLAYAPELGELGQPSAGLAWSVTLDKHYPNNPDILGNIGSFHNMLGQWEEGLPFVRRAVELRPGDPIDNWNLGWSLAHLHRNSEATGWMQKSITLPQTDESTASLPERRCLYGKFLVKEMADKAHGCPLVLKNCAEPDDRKSCTAAHPATSIEKKPASQ